MKLLFILIAVLTSLRANAQETTVTESETLLLTTQTATTAWTADFWGNFNGAPLRPSGDEGLASVSQPGVNYAYLATRYQLSPRASIGVLETFGAGATPDRFMSLGDAALSYLRTDVVATRDLSMSLEGLAYAPVSDGSRVASLFAGERVVATLVWKINGRLSLGLYQYVHVNEFTDAKAATRAGADDLYFYEAPFAQYRFLPKAAASVWIDGAQAHVTHTRGWVFDAVAAKPGVSWDVSSKLNVNPYVSFTPARISLASSFIGAFVSWRL